MATKGTCKFYTGDYLNTHCEAGVAYRDVTSDPDRLEGSAYRKPCIDWEQWNLAHGKQGFDNSLQAEEWARRGTCTLREEPSTEEIAASDAEIKQRTAEFLEQLNSGQCPHCGEQVRQRQVGRCVYGSCGHRLYQGKVNPVFAEEVTDAIR